MRIIKKDSLDIIDSLICRLEIAEEKINHLRDSNNEMVKAIDLLNERSDSYKERLDFIELPTLDKENIVSKRCVTKTKSFLTSGGFDHIMFPSTHQVRYIQYKEDVGHYAKHQGCKFVRLPVEKLNQEHYVYEEVA